MKKLLYFIGIIIIGLSYDNVFATENDGSATVTSTRYVNNQLATKQDLLPKNPATAGMPSVVSYTDTAGQVGSMPVLSKEYVQSLGGITTAYKTLNQNGVPVDEFIPSFAAIGTEITALDSKINNKQDIISAGEKGSIVLYEGKDESGNTKFGERKITEEINHKDEGSDYIPTTGAVIAYIQTEQKGQIPTYDELYDIMKGYKMEYPVGFEDISDDYLSPRSLSLVQQMVETGSNDNGFMSDFSKSHTGVDIISLAHALYGLKHMWGTTPQQTSNALGMFGVGTYWPSGDYKDFVPLAEAAYMERNNIKKGFIDKYADWRVPTLTTLSFALEDTIIHPQETLDVFKSYNIDLADIRDLYKLNINDDKQLAQLVSEAHYGRLVPDLQTLIISLNGMYNAVYDDIKYAVKSIQEELTGTPNALVTYNSNGNIGGARTIATSVGTDTTSTTIPTTGAVATAIATRQAKITCVEWEENTEHTDESCLIWNLAD